MKSVRPNAEVRLRWLMDNQPNNIAAINILRSQLGLEPLPEISRAMKTKAKLDWLMKHNPNNIQAINFLREKMGLHPIPPTVEGKGLRFSPEKHWVSRGRSTN